MAFLNKSKLAKRVAAIGVEDHLLLKETKLSESEKTAYLEGLVFATLMDDEKVDEGELEAVGRLAQSLHMDDAELKNCLETVKGLKTDDEKMAFAEEIVGALKRDMIPVRFVADVESLITKNGEIPPDAADGLDYLGSLLFEDQDWRAERDARLDVLEKTAKAKATTDLKALQETIEAGIVPFASSKTVHSEDLVELVEIWKREDLPQIGLTDLYLWVKNDSIGEITENLHNRTLEIWRRHMFVVTRSDEKTYNRKRKLAIEMIKSIVEKRCHKAWLLFALIMKKFDVEAVDIDKLAPLLRQAASKKAGSTKMFDGIFMQLAKDYLGECVAGDDEVADDVTSDDESASESV